MATYTSRLNATKPAGDEDVAVAVLNTNFDLFDSGVGATAAAAASKPASAFSGRMWYETDTGTLKVNTAASASTAAVWTSTGGGGSSSSYDITTSNGSNDTTAINAAWTANGGRVTFGPGTFYYSGSGLTGYSRPIIRGQGIGATVIVLSAGSYLWQYGSAINSLYVGGFVLDGGAGGLLHTYTGSNVDQEYLVEDVWFKNYTATAIGSRASDMPYWRIRRCAFLAANNTASIGVALSGLADLNNISECMFLLNRIHVKLFRCGNNAKLRDNDFIQFSAMTASNPRASVWCVPHTSIDNAGQGLEIVGGKFGNENLNSADYRILIADAVAGSFNTALPQLAADSTGYAVGINIRGGLFNGAGSTGNPMVYSTTQNLQSLRISDVALAGTLPSYAIQYRTISTTPGPEAAATNVIGPLRYSDNNFIPFPASNQPTSVLLIDPQGVMRTPGAALDTLGGSRSSGYVNLLQQLINSFTLGSPATKSAITDAIGGADATEVTFPGELYGYVPTSALKIDTPLFIEFDLLNGSSSVLTRLTATFGLDSGANFFRRTVTPDATWRTYRYGPFYSPSASNSTLLKFAPGSGSSGTKVKIGRVRVYHAHEPVTTDLELPFVPTTTSAPSAGGAGALPATPAGYVTVYINGTLRKLPYY